MEQRKRADFFSHQPYLKISSVELLNEISVLTEETMFNFVICIVTADFQASQGVMASENQV